MMNGGYVYLLHYHQPISGRHTARHYLGWTWHLSSRMQQHMTGRGARFTQVAYERGITFELAAAWPGSRNYERRLKNRKNAARLCPICRAARRAPDGQLTLDLDEDML